MSVYVRQTDLARIAAFSDDFDTAFVSRRRPAPGTDVGH